MTPDVLRSKYLAFFEKNGHRVVPSSPVVPEGDPTLLFTNAGMNQFKDVLLGLEKREYVRATSVQKCIRAGGKHNDLDEVGKDGRHLTFFEMLGNWSFGEYYKKEAMSWAWEFVTKELGFSTDRLYVSVYKDDDEAYDLWKDVIGVAESHITRLGDIERGDEENFWSMGPTGPCGPCTEIYFDHHPEMGAAPWEPGFDEERFVEIWNLVFMEFNRDETGEMTPLPIQSVDTGMGLDRVSAILCGVDNVFKTALFQNILEATHELVTGRRVPAADLYDRPDFIDYCVIADHVRSVTFCISEGATFSNEGRGYVLRRILRRAVRHGRGLGLTGPFMHQIAAAVVGDFGSIYPELRLKKREAAEVILREEERFFATIERGIELFEEVAAATAERGEDTIDGHSVFKLYDTFGFPPDLTQIMAEEKGLKVDEHGYQAAMNEQRELSKAAEGRYEETAEWIILQEGAADTFVGYNQLTATTDVLRYRIAAGGEVVEICLAETPFYAESGGQVGDQGILELDGGLILKVHDTRKTTAGITHFAKVVSGDVNLADRRKPVVATVDAELRQLTACNHTATHLLHAALHAHVNEKAYQAGSLVAPNRLRFDFAHDKPLTNKELAKVEAWVNDRIRANHRVKVHLNVRLEEAEEMGAMMMFGEKYGEHVRMVQVDDESLELCGGCHVAETNDIGRFRIVSESGVAAGVRRIEAVTNQQVYALAEQDRDTLNRLSELLKTQPNAVEDRIRKLVEEQRALSKRIDELTVANAKATAGDVLGDVEEINGVKVASTQVDAKSRDELLALADNLRSKLEPAGAALLAANIDGSPALLVMVTKQAVAKGIKAGDLIKDVAHHVDGRGGGKPTLAQAGGKNAAGIPAAVAAFKAAVQARLEA